MPELKRIHGTRIVSIPAVLDEIDWPQDALILRVAPDEVLALGEIPAELIADPHAIVEPESSFAGVWLDSAAATAFLERECEWVIPAGRPRFAQGAVAGLPVKIWLEEERVLFLVPAPYRHPFEERLP